jgi:hypothetical protein
VEQFCTCLMDFVVLSSFLNFTESHGGFLNLLNKICAADSLILRCIGLLDKCVAGGTDMTAT